ncbi:50S ribosomal protein L15 [bacterium]|nr:50S ribosomal protein L15 [bacterium]
MNLAQLEYQPGSKKKTKRRGRGPGSGHGKTSCRGHKGQHARSGAKFRAWFEGGQMPLQRRIPKRGFVNIFKVVYQGVNLSDLERLNKDKVSPETLLEARIVRKRRVPVKILGQGELKKAVEVKAHAFTRSAVQKIEAAGGKAIQIKDGN